jgi:hypothetical protein
MARAQSAAGVDEQSKACAVSCCRSEWCVTPVYREVDARVYATATYV